jgi:hypothetical protein
VCFDVQMKGNIHVAAGTSTSTSHQGHSHHIHHINIPELKTFNMSHTIHYLHFGEPYPGMETPPLDGATYLAPGIQRDSQKRERERERRDI